MDFKDEMLTKQKVVNDYLMKCMEIKCSPQIILDSMKYSLFAGGKRIRPILAISICEALNGEVKDVLPFAASLEMIHTYSLIHDDLPAMDNDKYRRGKLTNHMVYGESIAILAGDGLLNYAFENIFDFLTINPCKKNISAARVIAKAAGVSGMIGGQVIDIQSKDKKIDEKTLHDMHRLKTGEMIKASCLTGAIIAEANNSMDIVEEYGNNLGIAFQIVDDILDYTGDEKDLGKTIGKDKKSDKPTFISMYGVEKSRELAALYTEKAAKNAKIIDKKGFLLELTNYLLKRKN